jgi:hypothetical protein
MLAFLLAHLVLVGKQGGDVDCDQQLLLYNNLEKPK